MKIRVDIDSDELRQLVISHISSTYFGGDVTDADVKIEVKTKQNFKAEWEIGDFRATFYVNTEEKK